MNHRIFERILRPRPRPRACLPERQRESRILVVAVMSVMLVGCHGDDAEVAVPDAAAALTGAVLGRLKRRCAGALACISAQRGRCRSRYGSAAAGRRPRMAATNECSSLFFNFSL